ncbi:glycosyltransferase [Methylobacterium oxalidis]|uniref:glycosyltransferase n=1 Tax=Methylobacterium oxalidis TaxID=944322 RepID=UPI0033154AF5
MRLVKHLRGLAAGGRRWLTSRAAARPWFTIYASGIVVVVPARRKAADIQVSVRTPGGPSQSLPIARALTLGSSRYALAKLPQDWLARPGTLSVAVGIGASVRRKRFTVGPGRFSGRIDGVRGYALEGWVSPLFPEAENAAPLTVSLLVDGVEATKSPAEQFRRELMFASARGGWNGFRLPLPSAALDGNPHRLAVRVGDTVIEHGFWAAEPKFHIDSLSPNRIAGWFFDAAAEDAPTPLRLVAGGKTLAEVQTHYRPDLKAAFGREATGFAFLDIEVGGEVDLVAGPPNGGISLGRYETTTLAVRIAARRAEARAKLLAHIEPDRTFGERRAIRGRIVEVERADRAAGLSERRASPVLAEPANVTRIPPVCAIVPAYNGLSDLKLCLASLIPQLQPGRIRAIVINDGSPDVAVGAYLTELAAACHPGLTILDNPRNLGFIATVNRGFSLLEQGEDALLVNADTVLPPGLVERLARHCHARPGIASVTPMSNNATILSFPSVVGVNPPAFGLCVSEIDRAFAEAGGAPVELPTAVGFCMHLNRAALDEVGTFSTEWGRGYCEEVDWCLTARDLGWIHVVATDAFVVHEGSVSFGSAERLAILATNHARLEALYPEYVPEVEAFMEADPVEPVRIAAAQKLLAGRFDRLTLQISHGRGGGTDRYVRDMHDLNREPGHAFAVLAPVDGEGEDPRLEVRFEDDFALTLRAERVDGFLKSFEADGVAIDLHVNSRLKFDAGVLRSLLKDRPYDVMFHDFQWFCPRVHLIDGRHFYCAEPPPQICQICVTGGVPYGFGDQSALIESDLPAWLAFNAEILRGARRLTAPSRDTAARYVRRFGLAAVAALPHPEPEATGTVRIVGRRAEGARALTIAVVGAIGWHKGYNLLLRTVEQAARERAPILFSVVGITADDARFVRLGNASVSGRYHPSELKARLAAVDPDAVLLPSVWPETYSYVLSEVWAAGYPVVTFNFGAPAERIRAQGGGILIPPTSDPHELLGHLLTLRDRLASMPPHVPPGPAPATLEEYNRAGEPVTANDVPAILGTDAVRASDGRESH